MFATWGLPRRPDPVETSRLLEHHNTRVTKDIYVHIRNDMFDCFYDATA